MSWPGETPNPGMRVLLADDDPMVRRAMSFVLERLGYRVTAVENGTRAWEEASQARHDVVIALFGWLDCDSVGARNCEGRARLTALSNGPAARPLPSSPQPSPL